MIAVTEVKIEEIESGRYYTIAHFNPIHLVPIDPRRSFNINDGYVTTETVQGEQFINERGESVFIGWAKQAQDALGLPFMVFNKMQERANDLSYANAAQRQRIMSLEGESLYLEGELRKSEAKIESLEKENTDLKRWSLKERVKRAFFGDWG